MPEEIRNEVAQRFLMAYVGGDSCVKIAKRFGCSRITVSRYLKKYYNVHILSVKERSILKRKAILPLIHNYLKQGKTRLEIARLCHTSINVVQDLLPKKVKYNIGFASTLYDAGATRAQIGDMFCMTANTVGTHLKKHGVEMKPRGGDNCCLAKVPCIDCGTPYRGKTGYCRKCNDRRYKQKQRRNRIWSQISNERGASI